MIAFACSVGEIEPFHRYAEPGIRLAAEPDSAVFSYASVGTLGRSYNVLLDAAAAHDDLEALVIVHPHSEIVDPEMCTKVRKALSDPDVAVLGCAGATGVLNLAWWEGRINRGPVVHRYNDYGGGDLPAFGWAQADAAPAEVDVVDGFLLVLSPWAVRNVRFDEGLALHFGVDVDYCLQVRAAGRKVMTEDFEVIQHRPLELIEMLEVWTEAHVRLAEKWDGRIPGRAVTITDWRQRARRAEAEREAVRAIANSKRLAMDAQVAALEQTLDRTTGSASWRLTRPLRNLNFWRRSAADWLGRRDGARARIR